MRRRLVAGLALALGGCTTMGAVAPDRIQASEAALHEADGSGASKLPEANGYLQLAKEEIEQGKQLSSHRGELMLDRADEDTKLARVLAQKASLDKEVKEASERLKAQ